MKKYGIYLAYAPTQEMHAQGLGRYLTEFLKGAQEQGDVRFVIACPSWMKESLCRLLASSGVRADSWDLIAPPRKPVILALHQGFLRLRRKRKGRGLAGRLLDRLRRMGTALRRWLELRLVGTRSIGLVLLLAPFLLLASLLGLGLLIFCLPFLLLWRWGRRIAGRAIRHPASRKVLKSTVDVAARPKERLWVLRLYRRMEEAEAAAMRELIEKCRDVSVWYSPTAFWPHFNDIAMPRVMCVPDVVLSEFPVGFAPAGSFRFLDTFRQVEKAIQSGDCFITYSEEVKWSTLVRRYQIPPESVTVVPHGANRLDHLVMVPEEGGGRAATRTLCRSLFRTALDKAVGNDFAGIYGAGDVRFLFYASQFRPNKNLFTLLRAYEWLLRKRFVGHKLVLTGDPEAMPEVGQFIREHRLENDVLCLKGLSEQELAACYHLADLAVNPSLSEGGCPFTFTEALSVGTPVVMARIPVTEEVITDPGLQEMMLFDPFDWRDMAEKVQWALVNGEELLRIQRPFYEDLSRRTWREVVADTVRVLDTVANRGRIA